LGILVFIIVRKLLKSGFYPSIFVGSKVDKEVSLPSVLSLISSSKILPKKNDEAEESCCKEKSGGGGCNSTCLEDKECTSRKVTIIYGTTTGKSSILASQLKDKLTGQELKVDLINAAELGKDIDERMKGLVTNQSRLVVIISTHTEGSPPESASWFCRWLADLAGDFRVGHNMMEGLEYAVFGLGDSLYQEHYNTVGRDIDSLLAQLSATRLIPFGLGDDNVNGTKLGSLEADFEEWTTKLATKLTVGDLEEESPVSVEDEEVEYSDSEEDENEEDQIMDLEDIGKAMRKPKEPKIKIDDKGDPKEMVTPALRKSLTKQGYKIVGTHSGVKLCRWTKSMLRGRGGCYKHTFYGIESHRCMETTPSLACANKCVFCWRHHSNPVGTEWRWKMEDAEFVLKGVLENHYKMINEFKGVPGVLPDKLAEGMQAKHCALSLVGEPIMYPEINRFVKLLHEKRISSFLVTNAQFPDAIRDMEPCTQLYVSIDASTKESLKKIDRPLFKDFWERFLASLKELKEKGQRTVYRLTLVKGWNAEEMDNYAKLVEIGQPDLIEVKGVTYCGSSKASTLTMENVPWHTEVVRFVQDLVDRLPDYKISSEHEHSNCLLVAHKKFLINDVWHTWIDYEKFHYCIQKLYQHGESFSSLDYAAPTPGWAVFGATEQGFDPKEKRWRRKGKLEANVDGGCG